MRSNTRLILFSVVIVFIPLFWYLKIPSLSFSGEKESKIEAISELGEIKQIVRTPTIPDKLYFAGEEVPLWIPEVRERLENELIINTYWHSNTLMMLKIAPRWFPLFHKVFDSLGVPQDFKYVSLIESRLKNEDSPAGAAGFWHLMPASAKDHGLYMDEEVDERYDPVKATVVAGKYFLESKEKFGTWTDAAASYNRGKSGYSRAIQHQLVDHFYDLKLNSETSRYVFRIIAVKMIMESPEDYGFHLNDDEYYKPFVTKTLVVDSTVNDWAQFAQEQGTLYKYIRLYNPWIQEKYLKNQKRRSYNVLIPAETKRYKTRLTLNNTLKLQQVDSVDEFDKEE